MCNLQWWLSHRTNRIVPTRVPCGTADIIAVDNDEQPLSNSLICSVTKYIMLHANTCAFSESFITLHSGNPDSNNSTLLDCLIRLEKSRIYTYVKGLIKIKRIQNRSSSNSILKYMWIIWLAEQYTCIHNISNIRRFVSNIHTGVTKLCQCYIHFITMPQLHIDRLVTIPRLPSVKYLHFTLRSYRKPIVVHCNIL